MDTARLFQSGRSQAVRLPEAYRFAGTEVAVKRFGNGVLLLPLDNPWQTLEAGLAAFEPGFVLAREQPPTQERRPIGSLDTPTADHSLSREGLPATHTTLQYAKVPGLQLADWGDHPSPS